MNYMLSITKKFITKPSLNIKASYNSQYQCTGHASKCHTSLTSSHSSSNKDGITSNQRILDPKRGPVNRAAGVRSLPRVEDRPAREGQQQQQQQNGSPAPEKRSGKAKNLPKMEPAAEKKGPPRDKPAGVKK